MIDRLKEVYFNELKDLENAQLFLTDRTDLQEEIQTNMIIIGLSNGLVNTVSIK